MQSPSPRQIMAVGFFMAGDTRAEALRKAGYSRSSWHDSASNIFECASFKAEIERHQNRLRQKYHLDEDWVIERMMDAANAGKRLAKFKKVTEDGDLEWDFTGATPEDLIAINEITDRGVDRATGKKLRNKIGFTDPVTANAMLMRKLGMFVDKVEITGTLSLVERINRGRARALAGDDAKLIEGEVLDD